MSSISFGASGSVFRGTSRPLTRRSGGRPGFRWRSEASFFVTNFRSSVRSIWVWALASFYFNRGRSGPKRRPEATKPGPGRARTADLRRREGEVEGGEERPRWGPSGRFSAVRISSKERGRVGLRIRRSAAGRRIILSAARASSLARESPAARRKADGFFFERGREAQSRGDVAARAGGSARFPESGRARSLLASRSSSRLDFHLLRKSSALFGPIGRRKSARATRASREWRRETRERPRRRSRAAVLGRRMERAPDRSRNRSARILPVRGRAEELVELDEASLRGHPSKKSSGLPDFRDCRSCDVESRKLREKPRGPQDPQGILQKDPGPRRSEPLRLQILERAGRARKRAFRKREGKRVDGEVAPQEVGGRVARFFPHVDLVRAKRHLEDALGRRADRHDARCRRSSRARAAILSRSSAERRGRDLRPLFRETRRAPPPRRRGRGPRAARGKPRRTRRRASGGRGNRAGLAESSFSGTPRRGPAGPAT